MTFTALPQGCSHIDWQWEIPHEDASDPDASDRGALLTQFATAVEPAGALDSAGLMLRRDDLAAQGVTFAADPHLCQIDSVTGQELWAVPLVPLPDLT